MTSGWSTIAGRVWVAVLMVFGFAPIANWIPGGHGAAWYATSLSEWVSGSSIALGVAVVAFVILRRTGFWPYAPFRAVGAAAGRHEWATGALLGAICLSLYSVVARLILSGRPLLIDEIVQVMQARIFAGGRVALPVAEYPEFFSALHVVDVGELVYSQFPPGGPLMLVPGVLVGAPWLTGPVFGALAVVAWWHLVRRTEAEPGTALGAAILFGLAPFMAFMAGSHMNHVPTLAWLCISLWALQRLTTGAAGWGPAIACGLGFGFMASIRPVDGAAFALPAGLWLLWLTVAGRLQLRFLLAAGAGVVLPVSGVLAYNLATTGSATLFGYELLWGPSHGLGFHRAPWGASHSPARGLELVSLYFLRLQNYLFETPFPSLLPATAALLLVRRLTSFDRYLLVSSAVLVVGYFAYWHDGFFLGPRFFYLLLPVLVLWTARLPQIATSRFPGTWGAGRFVLLVYTAGALVAAGVSVPVRIRQYAGGLSSMRHDYGAPAARAGVEGAVILVRESWGAQLLARLWALGVPRSESEGLYRTIDTCILEQAVSRLEAGRVTGEEALAALTPLAADSARLVESQLSPDRTERVLPGVEYAEVCRRRIIEDRGGYTFLAPLLARDPGANVYARDLHARDTLLVGRAPGKPIFVLRASSSAVGAPLTLEPLNVDSARAEWGLASPPR